MATKIKCPKCSGTLKLVPGSNPAKYQCSKNKKHVVLADQVPGGNGRSDTGQP
jgi:hypothetical protein